MNQIVPPSFLFEYLPGIQRQDDLPGKGKLRHLPESATVFVPAQLNRQPHGFDLRLAWNPSGLAITVIVKGKQMPVAGSKSQIKTSDYVSVMLDTRHTANVHRATGYCTALLALPVDQSAGGKASIVYREIAQQRDVRHQLNPRQCDITVDLQSDGYLMTIWLPQAELPGFAETPEIGRIGFYLIVHDSELGELPLSIADDFPTSFDPSTWILFELKN